MMLLIAALGGYLIGSVSFAVLVSRAMGLADPRSFGSGNPGATNVLRTGNRSAALLTLLGDAGKGVLAVVLARWLLPLGPGESTLLGAMLAGLGAFVGHLFPVFHHFKGGKGVATAAGVLLAIQPVHGAATLATWLLIAFFFRFSSLAALIAAVFAPLYWVFLFGTDPKVVIIVAMSALLVWRHSANIGKLLAGKETRIGARKDAAGRVAGKARLPKSGRHE